MDHLPIPSQSCRPALKIPYLCNPQFTYDDLDFSTYPQRIGVHIDTLTLSSTHAPFLQAWLFFGTLSEIFKIADVPLKVSDFIIEENGEWYITTTQLYRYTLYWTASGVGEPDDRLPRIAACLRLVNETVNRLARIEFSPKDAVGHAVLLSIIILAESLDYPRKEIHWVQNIEYFSWSFGSFGKHLLVEAGWCLGELHMLEISMPAVLYYLSFFDRKRLGKDHGGCSEVRCTANQIDEKVYRTKHVSEGCGCQHVVVEDVTSTHRPVSDVLRGGRIPVLSLSSASTVVVSDTETAGRYVAISHVWSDGLGNTQRNSLPFCQLQKLQSLVDVLYAPEHRPVAFWVDTLCVPLEDDVRTRAIRMMGETYKRAEKVLVLDSSLQRVSLDASPEELMMRIRCTPWTQRLWTLQEGMLADELYFQFLGGAVQGETLIESYKKDTTPVKLGFRYLSRPNFSTDDRWAIKIHRALAADDVFTDEDPLGMENAFLATAAFPDCPNFDDDALLIRIYAHTNGRIFPIMANAVRHWHPIRGQARLSYTPAIFTAVATALRGRLTSKMKDETTCMATLFGIDPTAILQLPEGERMKALWRSLASVPSEIIFEPIRRFQEPGLRWAPKSFMNREVDTNSGEGFFGSAFAGKITPQGLKIANYFSYLLPEDCLRDGVWDFVMVEREEGRLFYVRVVSQGEGVKGAAVIVEKPPAMIPLTRGVLVSNRREVGGVLFGRFEVNIVVDLIKENVDMKDVYVGRKLAVWQEWCVE